MKTVLRGIGILLFGLSAAAGMSFVLRPPPLNVGAAGLLFAGGFLTMVIFEIAADSKARPADSEPSDPDPPKAPPRPDDHNFPVI